MEVQLPMKLQVDNSGVKDIVDGWSVVGRTRHLSYRMNWLRELKEQGILEIEWVRSEMNPSDLLSKNLMGPLFAKHRQLWYGDDWNVEEDASKSQAMEAREGVGMSAGDVEEVGTEAERKPQKMRTSLKHKEDSWNDKKETVERQGRKNHLANGETESGNQ